jgi:hypothetical protein
LVVREGAAAPDIATFDNFKKAMLEAKSVVHSNPAATPSGAHLGKAWEQLGIAGAMKPKLIARCGPRSRVYRTYCNLNAMGLYNDLRA